jgi:hypothetical protein
LFTVRTNLTSLIKSNSTHLPTLIILLNETLPTRENQSIWKKMNSPLCTHCRTNHNIQHIVFTCTKITCLRPPWIISFLDSHPNHTLSNLFTFLSKNQKHLTNFISFLRKILLSTDTWDEQFTPINATAKGSFLPKHRPRWTQIPQNSRTANILTISTLNFNKTTQHPQLQWYWFSLQSAINCYLCLNC